MTQKSSILGSGRRSRAGKRGSSNLEATVRRGVAPAMSVGASPGQGPSTWARSSIVEAQTSCHSCTPHRAWGPSHCRRHHRSVSQGRLCWCRGQVQPSWHSASQCKQEAGLVNAFTRVVSHEAAARPQAEGSVFLSVAPSAAIPPESHDSIASEIGSLERTWLVVEAVPGWPVSVPECR